ncbi:type II toxin-antitoxin system VapC family toxin [Leptolyngbya sp. 7M]|uniref:type II toxin-antitoxin system VapC family toxin n=1 Tax=Leptolyngbya sp. 7M TaxID=2812896 RepID=UPI0021F1EF60|nr:hypothetical protein [Leptolyngbya sp. 7M]
MKTIFADTGYWIALLDPQDTLHSTAVSLSITLAQEQFCTTEMVFTEVLNHFAKRGNFFRQAAAALIQSAQENSAIEIVAQTPDLFQQALKLYIQRPDQAWSHTDCASFCFMQQKKILEALAYDKHLVESRPSLTKRFFTRLTKAGLTSNVSPIALSVQRLPRLLISDLSRTRAILISDAEVLSSRIIFRNICRSLAERETMNLPFIGYHSSLVVVPGV